MKFNIKEYQSLLHDKKLLSDIEKTKLETYHYLLDDHFLWQNKENFCELIQLFLNKTISITEFSSKFKTLKYTSLTQSHVLQKKIKTEAQTQLNKLEIEINPICQDFEELISFLDDTLNLYDPDISFEMNLENPDLIGYGISEEFFRNVLKDNFLTKINEYGN